MNNLNWYNFASGYDPALDHDFIGFHCQRTERGPDDDKIIKNDLYAREYFLFIIDALPFEIRDKAIELGLMDKPDEYSDDFNEWTERVVDFLNLSGVRWIFVSDTRPLDGYGNYCYYVSMNSDDALWIFDDPNVNDSAAAYVYMINKVKPKLIPVNEKYDASYDDSEADGMYWGKRSLV